MNWPSKRIPQGGIFYHPKVNYSPEKRDFLRVLLNESKLSITQRQANYPLRSDKPSLNTKDEVPLNNSEILIRPGPSKRRSQATIMESGAYEREKFIPSRSQVDREKAKKHLQDFMEFGKDIVPTYTKTKLPKEKEPEGPPPNRFDQLVEEIRERKEWLKEMEALGEGSKYKPIIEQQIQCKLREMTRLKED